MCKNIQISRTFKLRTQLYTVRKSAQHLKFRIANLSRLDPGLFAVTNYSKRCAFAHPIFVYSKTQMQNVEHHILN